MAQFGKNVVAYSASRTLKIIGTENYENYTLYVIEVSIGCFNWRVKHRYSEFFDMHEKLVSDYKIDKSIFPPKKIFGKMSEAFIKKRQTDLEIYLQTTLHHLNFVVPPVLANFLDFHKYEIHGITETLAEILYTKGEILLNSKEMFTLQTLQLHAVNERLKLAEPTCESGDKRKDLGHVLDFITRVKALRIFGSRDPVGTSNIDMNQLKFDLTIFRGLEKVEIVNCNTSVIAGVEILKRTVKRLKVHHSLKEIKDILLQDIACIPIEKQGYLVPAWTCLRVADFSHNEITAIDESVKLMPKVEMLSLSHNQLSQIQHLSHLSALTCLDLSHNKVKYLDALHTKIGNLKMLNLSGNHIISLQVLSKLYSLEVLDLSSNDVSQVSEIQHICRLPCLEHLTLTGNPVTAVCDYRTKVFELFGERAAELCLDKLRPSQKELDTVAILQAIQKAREGREKAKKHSKKHVHEVPITDASITSEEGASSGPEPGNHGDVNHSSSGAGKNEGETNSYATCDDSQTTDLENSFEFGSTAGVPMNMPSITDPHFVHHMQVYIGSLNIQTHIPGITGSPHDKPEQILYIMWVVCHPYHLKRVEFPGCAVLTNEMVHIFELVDAFQDTYPTLSHYYSMAVNNVQETVTGYRNMYVRLEEAFMVAQGTFTLIPQNSSKTQQFTSSLRDACKINEEDFLITVPYHENAVQKLVQTLQEHEKPGLTEDDIVHYSYVQIPDSDRNGTKNSAFAAALTKHNLYLVREDVVHFPNPTFEVDHEVGTTQYGVLQVHSLQHTVKDVQFCNDINKLEWTSQSPGTDRTSPVKQGSAYGLTLLFESASREQKDGGESDSNSTKRGRFQCIFPTPEHRDLFLCQLMQLRREIAPQVAESDLETSIHDRDIDGQSLNTEEKSEFDVCEIGEDCCVTIKVPEDEQEPSCSGVSPNVGRMKLKLCLDGKAGPREMTVTEYNKLENWYGLGKGATSLQEHLASSPCVYPSAELLKTLTSINANIELLSPMSPQLKIIGNMTGEEVFNYFHNQVAQIGIEQEELKCITWCPVIPYVLPQMEILTCVMLSSRAVYLISDRCLPPAPSTSSGTPWKTHLRHQSDSLLSHSMFKRSDLHHNAASGIIHKTSKGEESRLHCYAVIPLKDLKQVHIGMFDQFFRLACSSGDMTFTCLTRDFTVTDSFVKYLMSALTRLNAASSPDLSSSDSEQDFYKMYSQSEPTAVSGFKQRNRVKFVYASDDAITDLCYLIQEKQGVTDEKKVSHTTMDILHYLLVFEIIAPETVENYKNPVPRTLILTNQHLCLVSEDYINYPLLDFVRFPPGKPNHEFLDVRRPEYLKRVVVSDFTSNDISLMFSDHSEDIVVDTSVEHFSSGPDIGRTSPGEIRWTILIQNIRDKDRLLKLLSKHWSDIHEGRELSIQVNA
ncbi:nischarin-like isoform X2 [Lineus longissimus]|uniref:nischarin-like isoform X2 n=1 Tax=Lineus longissimus TaxID=88925 RepID=UPI00315DB486